MNRSSSYHPTEASPESANSDASMRYVVLNLMGLLTHLLEQILNHDSPVENLPSRMMRRNLIRCSGPHSRSKYSAHQVRFSSSLMTDSGTVKAGYDLRTSLYVVILIDVKYNFSDCEAAEHTSRRIFVEHLQCHQW